MANFIDLPNRTLLYGPFMERQLAALQQLPGFKEIPLPLSLASQLSPKLVPAPPATWRLPRNPGPDEPRECLLPSGTLSPAFATSGVLSSCSSSALPHLTNPRHRDEVGAAQPMFRDAADRQRTSDSSVLLQPSMGNSNGVDSDSGAHAGQNAHTSRNSNIDVSGGSGSRKDPEKVQPLVRSWLFETRHLKRVRFTYFDGGMAVQAFNSLCYPRDWLDLPMLGVDLLSFGPRKLLCVIDLQPVTSTHYCPAKVSSALARLKERLGGALFQGMSSRFFQETRFFSPHIILFRSDLGWEDPAVQVPGGALFEALVEHLSIYHELLGTAPVLESGVEVAAVRRGQAEYDAYFSKTDPAIGLFANYFGDSWAAEYTHQFLFPLAAACEDEPARCT